ncbi:MAG: TrmB family transcriptional regulator [Promethearchaeota archaeon]
MSEDNLVESLERYGLTNYEIKGYLGLLINGISDAREVSNSSKVPYGRIYDVLSSLELKELVEVQDSRPKKYSAIEPRYALKKLLDNKEKELNSLTEMATVLEEKLVMYTNKKPEESLFWKISLGDECHGLMNEKLAEAQQEVLLYIGIFEVDFQKYVGEIEESFNIMSRLLKNGVSTKLLVGLKDKKVYEETKSLIDPFLSQLKHDKLEIKLTSTISPPFDVIDGEKVLLKMMNPVKSDEYFAALYVWQKKFATELRSKFFEMWDVSDKIDLSK